MFVTNHRCTHPLMRGSDAVAGILRDGGAVGVLAGAEEADSGPHCPRATGSRAAAVYGG